MESMYFLIPISFFFVVLAIGFYIWAVKGGQYDDLDTEGQRILFDEEPAANNTFEAVVTPEQNRQPGDRPPAMVSPEAQP